MTWTNQSTKLSHILHDDIRKYQKNILRSEIHVKRLLLLQLPQLTDQQKTNIEVSLW